MDGSTEMQVRPSDLKEAGADHRRGRERTPAWGFSATASFRGTRRAWCGAASRLPGAGGCLGSVLCGRADRLLVWSAEPRKYVDEDKAKFIREAILSDGQVESATELALLVNVIHWAASCPEDLVELAVSAVHDSVLKPDDAAYGEGRRANRIDDIDVALIRKVIFAGASDGGFTVSRWEAEMLLSLHDATRESQNSDEWRDLFVKGVANY